MKELISIVNSKFQAVIDELKNQKNTLEEKLKHVGEDIDKKVIVASKYKEDVEKSNNNISVLEGEIDKLKKDLHDLQEKFESAGFTGIVEAANKEINGKIIDNNTKISEEKDKIKNYQDEVQNLKDEITTLKDSKHNLERELNNTSVALNYYSNRIDDITIYAIENSDKLQDFNKVEETNEEEVVNKDIEGDIFKEIDDISTGNKEISDEELNELLNNKYENDDEEVELTKTQMLDDVINKTQEIINNTSTTDQFVSLLDEENQEQQEVTPVEEINEEENNSQEGLENLFNTFETPEEVAEETTSEITEEPTTEEVEETVVEEQAPVEIESEEEVIPVEEEPVENEETTISEVVPQETKQVESVPELTTVNLANPYGTHFFDLTPNTYIPENEEVKEVINKLGLKPELFDESISKIQSIDYDNAVRIIDCLDLHFIDTNNVYKYPSILVTMKSETLDKILDLLEQAGCVATTFDHIFKYLDKIDLNLLQTKVTGKTDCIIGLLYDSIHNLELRSISDVLALTDEETTMLESKLDAKEYNVMCAFSDIVQANYELLKGYHVADINKCFTEHPKRFLLNPEIFETILDKYDPQDLVRCINKNPAVLDRL